MPYHNGVLKARKLPPSRSAFLGGPLTGRYKASNLASGTWHWALQRGSFNWGDINAMRRYHAIEIGLRVLRAPIFSAKWEIEADSHEVAKWIDDTLTTIWHHDLIKILRMLEWGAMGGEIVWDEDEDGLIKYESLKEIHLYDIRPLERDGELAGVSIRTLAGQQREDRQYKGLRSGIIVPDDQRPNDNLRIPPPRSFWIANEAEFGSFWGRSRLQGAYEPWMEHSGKHGAVDIRRLWFIKCCFRGGLMRHPMGTIEVDGGRFMACEEYAREIIEKMETGGVLTLPDAFDPEASAYRWTYEEPKLNGSAPDLLQYPKDLDLETLQGLGIMPEVIQMADGGGGWSGRSVPMLVFLNSEDQIVSNVIYTADKQVIRPGVDVNFGTRAKYKITPVSLVPKEEPQGQPGQPGQPPGAPGPIQDQPVPGQGNGNNAQPMPGQMPRPAGPVQMSQSDDGWVELPEDL